MENTVKIVDLVIVGSGAAAVCAALVAKDMGLTPLIVEKMDKFGGTTAYSGGGMWIPDNPVMEREGIPDSFERAMTYMDAAIWHNGPSTMRARREAYARNGRAAVQYLESKGMKFRRARFWPDYHSDLPGSEQTSRSLFPQLFNLNELGEWKEKLNFSKMAQLRVSTEELSTAVLMKRTLAGKLFALRMAGRLLKQKLLGRDLRGGGAALQGRLLQIALREDIEIWLDTPVTGLVLEKNRVVGVNAERHGREITVQARRGVLLNTGGFARNPEMRLKYNRQPVYPHNTNASPGDTGEMMLAAMGIGADTDCMEESGWGVTSMAPDGSFPEGAMAADGTPLPFSHHFDISLPHSILVDQDGNRFTNEACSYFELAQHLYNRHEETGRGIPAWAIIESRHRDRYLWGPVLGKTPQSWLDSGYMQKADTIEELAAKCGIDAAGLRRTTDRFNGFAHTGVDTDYGRGAKAFDRSHGDPTVKPNPNIGAIERPPFYAVAIYPGDTGTWGGLVTDENGRVLRDGKPIAGLYAAGVTTASIGGRTYFGAGFAIGPSMTFGYVAARHASGAN